MKRKSFGKLAIVTLLAVAMLLSLCVCSKKAETKPTTTTTTTTNAKVETTQPSTTTTVAKAEEPAPAPTPAVEVKAEEVKEEPKEEVKVEEPVVETTPEVVEEAKVEEPVVEEEVASEETPIFSTLFTYNGVTSSIVAYSNHATVSIPSGVSEDDIAYLASLLTNAYPEAKAVTYSVVDGKLELTYPEQASEFIVAAINTLETDAKALIDGLTAPVEPVVEEVSVAEVSDEPEQTEESDFSIAEDGTIKAIYSYHNLANASITMTDTEATIHYPSEYIYKSDIEDFIANIVNEFPYVADYVTYSIPEDGTLVISYPSNVVDEAFEKVEVLAYLNDVVTEYADSVLSAYLVPAIEPVEEAVAKAEEAVAEETVEAPVFSSIFSYKGITANIIAYSDYATISIPEGVTEDDINAIASELVESYPMASAVTYSLDGNNLVLSYPEQSDDFILVAITQLENDAKWLIDQLTPVVEEAVAKAEEPVAEEVPLFSTIFTYKGVTSNVIAYSDHATISIPEGVTEKDINAIASELVKAYPMASAVTYSLEGDNLVLTYPEESEDFIASVATQLSSDARWLIDQLTPVAIAKVEEVAPVVEEVKEAPVETAKAEEPVAPVVAPEVPAAPVETVEVVAPSVPVAAPVAQKESFIKGYTASITATPKANVSSVWEKPFVVGFGGRFALDFGKFSVGVKASYDLSAYIPLAFYGKYNFVELGNGSLYGLFAAGANIGLNGRTPGALFELGVGYEYNFSEMFSAFAEVTGQYTTNNKFEVGATLGASVKF